MLFLVLEIYNPNQKNPVLADLYRDHEIKAREH